MKMNVRAGIAGCLAFLAAAALAADNSKTISLCNGKDLSGWKTVGGKGTNQWKFGKAALDAANPKKINVDGPGEDLISPQSGANLSTEASYKDCIVELEFMMAKNSNSGVKMMNIYEIQIFDSFGKEVAGKSDCGAVYQENAPKVNACKKPGEWQTLVIEFRAPRFDESGNKTANAKFVKVTLNGQVVQENVEIAHGTNVARTAKEHPTGPIYLQGDHGPVAFRNLKVTPLN
ncbi:MAG: DUF1080 domain-containing protein [Verrucomicrobia bacterium]|nr:DUF1080 domain-containing protein [Verrucomicrobiota bacterium]